MTVVNNNSITNNTLQPLNNVVQNTTVQPQTEDNTTLNTISNYVSSGLAGGLGAVKSMNNIPVNAMPVSSSSISGGFPPSQVCTEIYQKYDALNPEVLSHYRELAGKSPNFMSDMNMKAAHSTELETAHLKTIRSYEALEIQNPNDPNITTIKEFEILKYKTFKSMGTEDSEVLGVKDNGLNTLPESVERPSIGTVARSIGSSAMQGGKFGAIFGGITSAVVNGYQLLTGKKTGNEAMGTFIADTAGATVSGATGSALGGLAFFGLSSMGLASLPLTVITAGVGLVGAIGANLLFNKTGLYDAIKNLIK